MLGTGGSGALTISLLKEKGVLEENITFVCIVGCEEGIKKLVDSYPKIKILSFTIDPVLTS